MNRYITETLANIKNYLENSKSIFHGMLNGNYSGGFRRIMSNDRSYFVLLFVNEQMEMFFVDVFPGCFCEKPYRGMMNAYLNEKTSSYKCGRVDIDRDNGEVSVRITSSIKGQAVSEEAIESMVALAVNISDGLEKRLDKMAHGVYFKDDDPELKGSGEKKRDELMEKLRSLVESADDEDEASEDSDENLLERMLGHVEEDHTNRLIDDDGLDGGFDDIDDDYEDNDEVS